MPIYVSLIDHFVARKVCSDSHGSRLNRNEPFPRRGLVCRRLLGRQLSLYIQIVEARGAETSLQLILSCQTLCGFSATVISQKSSRRLRTY